MAPGIADPAAGPAPSTADPEVPRDVSSGITVPGSGRRRVVDVIYTSPLDTDFPRSLVDPNQNTIFFTHGASPRAPGDTGRMDLYHRVTGAGPTVVLIHGVCHRGHAWDPVVPLLEDRYRLVIVDLPGHGNSPDLPEEGDPVEYMVDQLTTMLDGILPPGERAHFAGNSLGGFLALEMAARGHAHSATALSPAGFFRSYADWRYTITVFHSLQKVAGKLGRYIPALSQRAAGRALMMGAFCARPWQYGAEAAAIDGEAIITNTVLDRADRRAFVFTAPVDEDVPLTIRWGRFDLVLPAAQRQLAARLFPRARIEISADGHVPMSDDPRGVADSIAATVERGLARDRELARDTELAAEGVAG